MNRRTDLVDDPATGTVDPKVSPSDTPPNLRVVLPLELHGEELRIADDCANLSKALLLLTISLVVPAVARPALAGVHGVQGRRHRHKHHERRREHQREHEAREGHGHHDGERHGEL
jgi:hypothetical protein